MALQIASLNSGSNGNCYYIGNATEAVLIDAGLSLRETEKRMKALNLSLKKVWGIFISHEHTDHIKGASTIANKYNIPLYISEKTFAASNIRLVKHLTKFFSNNDVVQVGSLSIKAFSKLHDAIEPFSFTITDNGVTIGVFTDIGLVCSNLIAHFKQCHAAFLESNYDEAMLQNGRYSQYLKNRIRGGHGHISNVQAAQLFVNHKPNFMSHLFLAHLSKENNTHDIALSAFTPHAGNTNVMVASRYKATDVFTITANNTIISTKAIQQLNLF